MASGGRAVQIAHDSHGRVGTDLVQSGPLEGTESVGTDLVHSGLLDLSMDLLIGRILD